MRSRRYAAVLLTPFAGPPHRVSRVKYRSRLPHLRPPQHACALSAAACATRHQPVAALARTRVAAAVVPRQPASAAAVLQLPAFSCCVSPCLCHRPRRQLQLRPQSCRLHLQAQPGHLRQAAFNRKRIGWGRLFLNAHSTLIPYRCA